MDALLLIAILLYLMFVIYAANQVQAGVWEPNIIRLCLMSLVGLLFILAPCSLQALILSSDPALAGQFTPVSLPHALFVAVFAGGAALFSYQLVQRPELRVFVSRYVKQFNPDSPVHLTAIVMCLLALSAVAFEFMLAGGVSGIADSYAQSEISLWSSVLETALLTAAAFLGVGFAIRRGGLPSLERLGLRIPTQNDAIAGVALGIALYGVSAIFSAVWITLSDPQTFAEQTRATQEINSQLASLPVAILVGGGAAIGEEIFIRGALQPIFGLWLTSAFFALLHSQYLLTPTLALVFVLGLSFGRLRQLQSTTAAVIAHFVYNVIPFVLFAFQGGMS
ncbi:MAG: CPBP family intramembrane metalloprotease [Chloroflexi bacterium]|nr:CPBP family intramembrane metalloprotease [Chloroflexota bacterium]